MLEFKFIKRNCEWLFICLFFSIVVFNMANNNQNIIMGSELMVKLNLTNFLEWEAKLVEIVKLNGLEYVLSHPMPSYYARDMTP